jgi:hypothetical protein
MFKALAITALLAVGVRAEVRIEKINFKGWPNSYRMTNGEVELVVTSDIGPRIMRYGFVNGQNLFWEQPEGLGKSGEQDWQLRGGHRIWIGPEDIKYTYGPDNGPIDLKVDGKTIIATSPVEPSTGIQKQLIVNMDASGTEVRITHRLINKTNMPLEYAAWALTMMAPGGVGITGFPPRGTHPKDLPPTNPLVMWAFTNLSDKRWTFLRKYFTLRQDPNNADPQKLGHHNNKTWGAYLLWSDLFLKRYDTGEPAQRHPDFGCSFEMFTNDKFLEIETMGPLQRVLQGASVEHVERWSLHKNVKIGAWTDEELDRVLVPLMSSTR